MTTVKNATETKRGPGRPAGVTNKKRTPAQIIADTANRMIKIQQGVADVIRKSM